MDAPDPLATLYRDFLALHDRIFGHGTEAPAAIVNLRSVHRAGGADRLNEGVHRPSGGEPRKPSRPIRIAGASQPVNAAIYDRAAMPVGMCFAGPAIVEQADTTTLVEPSWNCRVLDDGTLLLERS